MACKIPPINQITNNAQFVTATEVATMVAAEIAQLAGIALVVGETFWPLAPFIWAAVGIEFVLGAISGGRPKDQDTNSVIWAYHMSAYWPLNALGDDLAIFLKNGAPISDSRPEIQAQFSQLKLGTIESIQQLAGLPPGPGSPGFWQLQQFINTSWAYSKLGNQAVLNVVKAIDCFTEYLSQLAQQSGTQPPPEPPPIKGIVDDAFKEWSYSRNGDELADGIDTLVFQNSLIYKTLQKMLSQSGSTDPQCCTKVVTAIGTLVSPLADIAKAIADAVSSTPPGTPPPDLTPIADALAQLGQCVCDAEASVARIADAADSNKGGAQLIADAISKIQSGDSADVKRIADLLEAQAAKERALVEYWNSLGIGDPGVNQILTS